MEQRCHLAMIWLTWLGVPLLAVLVGLRTNALAGLLVLGIGIVAQVLYIRWFPHLSRWMGYGPVDDTPAAPAPVPTRPSDVTLYTANACPFCPIVRRRLAALQREQGFNLREIDVTFRPEIIWAKGLRSVPVLEANGQLLMGNATSAQISEFLATASKAKP
ncbi:MAG TPA: glutaredoxin family protein [Vicinamibacterales bacterium]|nr:glutaredoxin family protein [Vicinamibacterales bacterium]